jgi:hypothetical protein
LWLEDETRTRGGFFRTKARTETNRQLETGPAPSGGRDRSSRPRARIELAADQREEDDPDDADRLAAVSANRGPIRERAPG